MPPPEGISYAMTVLREPSGGRIDDHEDQHDADRPGEGQLSGLHSRGGRGGSIQPRGVADASDGVVCRAAGVNGGDGSMRHHIIGVARYRPTGMKCVLCLRRM